MVTVTSATKSRKMTCILMNLRTRSRSVRNVPGSSRS
jgi:hypothetical protein